MDHNDSMNDGPKHLLRPWSQAWYDYQKSALGESACRQLGFYVIPDDTVVSVIVPFHNEQQTLQTIVERVAAVPIAKEIILIDDGSTDDSPQIARRLADEVGNPDIANNRIRIQTHKTNRGKGEALKTGFALVSGDVVVLQDADLEYDPLDIPRLLQPIMEQKADVVYGSRFLGNPSRAGHQAGYFWNTVGNRFLTSLSNAFTNLKLTDIETGYKAFTREVVDAIAPSLVSQGFAIEPEITARVAREKVRVYEVPVGYSARTFAQGKKIRWYDGLEAAWSIVKFGLFD